MSKINQEIIQEAVGNKESINSEHTTGNKTSSEVDKTISSGKDDSNEEQIIDPKILTVNKYTQKLATSNSIMCSEFQLYASWALFPNLHGHQNYGQCKVRGRF
mmetsp:Transcript_1316/g.1674  ORF Transcript_1316/g.1674 Transcript_1316/m.1674 type:complete len:103 (-) Transcript_1316:1264-1572(-)